MKWVGGKKGGGKSASLGKKKSGERSLEILTKGGRKSKSIATVRQGTLDFLKLEYRTLTVLQVRKIINSKNRNWNEQKKKIQRKGRFATPCKRHRHRSIGRQVAVKNKRKKNVKIEKERSPTEKKGTDSSLKQLNAEIGTFPRRKRGRKKMAQWGCWYDREQKGC